MVHEMSGEPESVIREKMPMARGLQYQVKWLLHHGTAIQRNTGESGLKRKL